MTIILIVISGLVLIGILGGTGVIGGTVTLASAMEGTLVKDGTPVASAPVKRTMIWAWTNQTFEQHTTTDDEGTFTFPAYTSKMFFGFILPAEPSINTSYVATVNNVETEFMYLSKGNYHENGETTESTVDEATGQLQTTTKPFTIACNLDQAPGSDQENTLYWSNCVLREETRE